MSIRALVIGYGSIGSRHARLLNDLGCDTAVHSARSMDFPLVYPNLQEAIHRHDPDYVVIANATEKHRASLVELAEYGYTGRVLVEKPLLQTGQKMPANRFSEIWVGYNLRFHPVLGKVRELLADEKLISVQAYAGQYLPHWRPGTDYRQSYSARRAEGGGVLRDLSHELDYLGALFGGWQRVTALGGHFSSLDIDSDDVFSLLWETTECPIVSLQMNYLDRPGQRYFVVQTTAHTIVADFRDGTVRLGGELVGQYEVARDQTYTDMHRLIMSGQPHGACTLAAGLETMGLIEAAENAAQQGVWIRK